MFERKVTRQIKVGDVFVGGDAPISVQSMTTTKTGDTEATLKQISGLAAAGCDIIRCAVPTHKDAEALQEIAKKSPIPVIADIHFDPKLVLKAIDSGVAGVRVNPGNIRNFEEFGPEIVKRATEQGISLRIGVNAGSIDPKILKQYSDNGIVNARCLVESALKEAAMFKSLGFFDFKISVKHHDPLTVIDAYQMLSSKTDCPLHIGVTEAGPQVIGLIKSCSTLGILLSQGIGDTIRISLTADPVEEVKAGVKLLESLGLHERTLNIISCPTCGRTSVDLINLTKKVEQALDGYKTPINVAVMGCEVNGPGEAREADIGIACGNGIGKLFIKGQVVETVSEDEIVKVLVDRVQQF
jgi:(E)-4-hydroxy-3-methylbut-2-enyl-diphosphate synthase